MFGVTMNGDVLALSHTSRKYLSSTRSKKLTHRPHLIQVKPWESEVVAEWLSARGPDSCEPPGNALPFCQVRIEGFSQSDIVKLLVPQDVDAAQINRRAELSAKRACQEWRSLSRAGPRKPWLFPRYINKFLDHNHHHLHSCACAFINLVLG